MEASLRETLRGQVAAAQAELAANLALLNGADAALASEGEAQMGALSALHRALDTAGSSGLATLRAAVVATVASSLTVAQQARAVGTSAASATSGGGVLASITTRARETVTAFERDMFERRIFDPYLSFASTEDEAAYRTREVERHTAIDAEMAKNTPQGTLEANRIAIDQLRDAGAHGADRSPVFTHTLERLENSRGHLEAAVSKASADRDEGQARVEAATSSANDLAAAAAQIDPAILAAFGGLTKTPEQTIPGHGVAATSAKPSLASASPAFP